MDQTTKKNNFQQLSNSPTHGISDNFPNRKMWEEIAEKFNGKFNIKHTSGNVFEIHNITIPHKKWTINISVSDTRPLKFQVSFDSIIDFEITISWEDLFERILKKLGKPEIELGWDDFDKHYLIKSNHPDLVKKIFTLDIQKIILKHNINSIVYQTDSKNGTSEILSVIQTNAGSKDEMIELIVVFKLIIDNLDELKIIR
ncbi:MAG: hypothetical protein H6Q19_1617 [Bacteroidetes bacterium]|nr:hypothetical protein [Bacteroidota bacterium]